jgi:pSer/pThr/pTyr-binding forkhead associated (FHA) protein
MTLLAALSVEPEAQTALPHLIGLQPAVQPHRFVLDELECALGRGLVCEIVVPFPFVSRVHAQVELLGGRFQLRDQGSVNGTFVNGIRLERPHLLTNHDVIGLGESGAHLTYVDPDTTQNRSAGLDYDDRSMRFSLCAARLDLTPNQFRLLRHLHGHRGQVCTREQLAEAVWGADYLPGMDATTLDRLVSTLRGALRRADAASNLVVTRPGLGYELSLTA